MENITLHNPVNLQAPAISAAFQGDKLSKLRPGEEVKLVDSRGQELSYAEVIDIWAGPLANAPAILLEMSHDPLQRTFAGLHTHLGIYRAKGADVIQHGDALTILVLRLKKSTLIRPTQNEIGRLGK